MEVRFFKSTNKNNTQYFFFLSIGVSLSFSMKFSVCSFVDVLETHQN